MFKRVITLFFFIFTGIWRIPFVVGEENASLLESVMVIGIQSTDNIPGVKTITRIQRSAHSGNLHCRDFPVVPAPGQNSLPLLLLYDSTGEILFQTTFGYPVARTVPPLDPALPGSDEVPVPGVIFLQDPEVFLVVPYFKEAKFIALYNPGESVPTTLREINPAEMEFPGETGETGDFFSREPPPVEVGAFHLLIIASGYRAGEMKTFTAKATELKSYLLSKEPFQSDSDRIEVHIYENLADLGCYNGCNEIERLMCCNSGSVISTAAASGYRFDEIVVLHNTEVYSGGGYREYLDAYKNNSYTTYTMSYSGEQFKRVALHELGHSFGNLCDEYSYTSEGISYQSCVNCRENCVIWNPISLACQPGCSARSDYFRPENSIMLILNIEHFNPVSLYATFLPDGLHQRLRFFIQGPLPVQIFLLAARKEERAWLIRKQYGEIDFVVDNPVGVQASTLVVSRKDGGGDYLPVKVIPFTDLENNSFSFLDQFLDRDTTYTYKTEALASSGNVIGVSDEVTL